MGAAASTNVSTSQTSVISDSINSCQQASGSNTVNISGLRYTQPPNCPAGNTGAALNITQGATVDANCLISAMVKNMSSNYNNMSTQAQAGFGIAASTNVATNQQNIQT